MTHKKSAAVGHQLSSERQSELMSRIRSKGTTPELLVRSTLHAMGYRYALHMARLPGTPDIGFPARRKVIFVNGCFWHGHACGRGFRPLRNGDFWAAKIDGNKARDRRNGRALRKLGWGVFTVWECETGAATFPALQWRLIAFLES